jgi:hypothetical protein
MKTMPRSLCAANSVGNSPKRVLTDERYVVVKTIGRPRQRPHLLQILRVPQIQIGAALADIDTEMLRERVREGWRSDVKNIGAVFCKRPRTARPGKHMREVEHANTMQWPMPGNGFAK